jgi:D-alanyl-D-alanine carboxypeptidase (penicillin-binding protein 5/6)
MPPARGTAVVIAVLAAVLAIAALVLQSATARPADQTGPAARSGLAGRGGLAARGRPGARSRPHSHGAAATAGRQRPSWLRTVGGRQLASRGVVVHYPARGRRRLPTVHASAYVIADAGTGQVLAAKDPHGDFPPASTLKVLTAITLIPLLNPAAAVVATRRATSVQPNIVGLRRGRSYQVSSLFKALLLISANDAAVSLAQATGSFRRAITLMNAEAHWLQAYDVVARDPNGLPAAHQHVSAYDEALIARRALAMPAFMKYDSTLAARFRVKRRRWVTLVNQNTLLMTYRGGIGGKIGWTERARATYIGMARRHGVTLIVTILHARPLTEITSGERLLNWGFAMDRKVRPVGALVPPLPGGPPGR